MKNLTETKLRTLRVSKGWSQEFVAEKIHVTQAAYSKLECGQVQLTINRAKELAKLYGISPDYFFTEEQMPLHQQRNQMNIGTIITDNYRENDEIELIIKHYENILAEKNKQIKLLISEIDNLRKERKKFWKLISSFSDKKSTS